MQHEVSARESASGVAAVPNPAPASWQNLHSTSIQSSVEHLAVKEVLDTNFKDTQIGEISAKKEISWKATGYISHLELSQ
jgi:hypothetical protein